MSARVPTSPTRAISLPLVPSTSTISPGCRRTSRRLPSAALAIAAGLPPARQRSAPARCSPRSRAPNTTAPGTCPTMSARSTACCATARAPRPTALRCRRWPIPTAGIRPIRWRSAPSTRTSSAASARSTRPTAEPQAVSACPATGRIRASSARARPTPMWCARRCSCSTILPICSMTPSMATSSARSTAARCTASTPATVSIGALPGSRIKPASG